MVDSKSGGMTQAQKKINTELLNKNNQWIEEISKNVESGKVPEDIGNALIEKLKINGQRIQKGVNPIIDNIEFLKGNTEEGESELKIKIYFNKATQKTQKEEFFKVIQHLNDKRDAQQIESIVCDIPEDKNIIELFKMPPLQKAEVNFEVIKHEPMSTYSPVQIEEIQTSTDAIKSTIHKMEETIKQIEKSKINEKSSFLRSIKNFLNDAKEAIKYKIVESEWNKIQEERQRYIDSITKLIKENQKIKAELEKEKGENKEKIEQLMAQQQQLVEQMKILKGMIVKQKPEPESKQKPQPKSKQKPQLEPEQRSNEQSRSSVSSTEKTTSPPEVSLLSFSDIKTKNKFEKHIITKYKNELIQLLSPSYLSKTLSINNTEDETLAKMLGFNVKTEIGVKYKYTLSFQQSKNEYISVNIEIEWKGDNKFDITLTK